MAILFGVVNSTRAQSISTTLLEYWTPIRAETPELAGNISPFISGFEVQAHFTVGQTARALELIRRCWGWYLNNPLGTQSTVIEGYLTDGAFGYPSTCGYHNDASYVSHSYGWSAGPTSALTNFVLGLSVTGRAGSSWRVAPQFSDWKTVKGGFVTSLGMYQANWVIKEKGYTLDFNVPEGTNEEMVLPLLVSGTWPKISINRKELPASCGAKIVDQEMVYSAVPCTCSVHQILRPGSSHLLLWTWPRSPRTQMKRVAEVPDHETRSHNRNSRTTKI